MYILGEPGVFQEHSGNVGGLDVLPARPPVQQAACFPPPVVCFYYFPSGLDVSIILSLPLVGEFASKKLPERRFLSKSP